MTLQNKIDFAVIFSVKNANPNGDPLNENRPRRVRVNGKQFGEVSDVCLKRKIRDRLQEDGQNIFVQSEEKKEDELSSLQKRAEHPKYGLGVEMFKKGCDVDETKIAACKKWFDVRSFGQVFAFNKNFTASVRGPVTIQSAFSVEPVNVTSTQITKSVNSVDKDGKASDTMGMKHRVDQGVYVTFGSISPQLAERTGFTDADADVIKEILPKLFNDDESSARPAGSMEVEKVIWWKHDSKCGQYSPAKVHRTLKVNPDGTPEFDNLPGLVPQKIDGF